MENASAQADVQLLKVLGDGSSEAMAELYSRHGRAAYLLAYSMLHDAAGAEDVVQDAFLSLWRNAGRYDERHASLRTWLLSIVRNRAIDVLRASRHRRTELPLLEEIETSGDVPDGLSSLEDRLSRQVIREALGQLPAEQRQTIELIYFGGYTYEEAARLTNAPLGTVKSRLRAALQRLRALLTPETLGA